VKTGVYAVVNAPGGTGAASRLYEVKAAGKTGTSQVVKLRAGKGGIPYQYRDHALFVVFAPYEKPEIAVAVVVEHGEHGGSAAAPIAGKILRAYFEGKGVIRKPKPPGAAAPAEGVEEPAEAGAEGQVSGERNEND
jgi:penicillin-binding protein 2